VIKHSGVTDFWHIGALSAIPYVVGAASMYLMGRSSDRRLERRWHFMVSSALAAGGVVLLPVFAHDVEVLMVLLSIATAGYLGMLSLFWTLPPAYLKPAVAASGIGGGVELILGLHRDPLGTAVLLGMGGVTAELIKDTTMRLLDPLNGLSSNEAMAMIRELKTFPLLDGYRGQPRADIDALASAMVAFSRMAVQLGERLVEAEINPLFVLPRGYGVKAADGVAIIRRQV
jgi:hypothetical protein